VLAGCSNGIANAPAKRGGAWNIIPAAGLARTYLSVSDGNGDGTSKANSVVGACMGEVVFGTLTRTRTFTLPLTLPLPLTLTRSSSARSSTPRRRSGAFSAKGGRA